MPLFYPATALSANDVDMLLASGFRRSGQLVYFTRCTPCHACEPTRVDVNTFRWSRSFKRVLNRAEKHIDMRWQSPQCDADRLRLYNKHREGRNLGTSPPIDADDYRSFLLNSCFETLELEMRVDGELIGISIMDVGQTSISAVYTHFDPNAARFSPGTLAVLKQIQWAQNHHRRWAYLGLYVASNPHLNYKARFQPQERRINDIWVSIDESRPEVSE